MKKVVLVMLLTVMATVAMASPSPLFDLEYTVTGNGPYLYNGYLAYLGGGGDATLLLAELDSYGLSDDARRELLRRVGMPPNATCGI